jgi:hypothetical protein
LILRVIGRQLKCKEEPLPAPVRGGATQEVSQGEGINGLPVKALWMDSIIFSEFLRTVEM